MPPSEGKTAPPTGPTLDLASLSIPAFTDLRRSLVDEIEHVSRRDDAADILTVGASVADEIVAQRRLSHQPCAPAHEVYAGVLYQAADFANLSPRALARAKDSVLIFSALFGATSPADLIPRYRLKMGVKLPGGTPKSRWRPLWKHLDDRAEGELVIDGRSADYAGWKPPASAVHVTIGAVRETNGARKVITHNAKHYRGVFTGLALRAESPPGTAEELAHLAMLNDPLIGDIELTGRGRRLTLTVVEKATVEKAT
nr:peroxide stress protein YaaA [Flaviflexus huanghaiensis]